MSISMVVGTTVSGHVFRIPNAHRETTSNRAHGTRESGVAAATQQCLTACTRARAVCTSESLGGAVHVESAYVGGAAAARAVYGQQYGGCDYSVAACAQLPRGECAQPLSIMETPCCKKSVHDSRG